MSLQDALLNGMVPLHSQNLPDPSHSFFLALPRGTMAMRQTHLVVERTAPASLPHSILGLIGHSPGGGEDRPMLHSTMPLHTQVPSYAEITKSVLHHSPINPLFRSSFVKEQGMALPINSMDSLF
ncbi:hypothetical protein GOP47_0023379 [Adiantum capillus-veneris]|uniref:Uncharacterized protein n=1 Tax=Adiantum capillus-veneris TaxID=13818 RepID=A0A9D4U3D9_ADICA|nr:hypothetical protein GOP47_0023379 [Adiantum capillus-veneris]